MKRGTTPQLQFILPFDVSEVQTGFITMVQSGKEIAEKSWDECSKHDKCVIATLNQEETMNLKDGLYAEIQVRVKTKSGLALASDIFKLPVDRILKEGVI